MQCSTPTGSAGLFITSRIMRWHNPPGTQVSVSLTVQNNQIVIDFSDDGAGIPEHLKETIFRPFVRADESRNSKTGGSGLGLSIAKRIAEAHRGDLTLLRGEDRGSTFRVMIPAI